MNEPAGDTKAQAFNQGYDAYEGDGYANPYGPDTVEYFWYQRGWDLAAEHVREKFDFEGVGLPLIVDLATEWATENPEDETAQKILKWLAPNAATRLAGKE